MGFSENDKKIPQITFSAGRTGSQFFQAPNLQCD